MISTDMFRTHRPVSLTKNRGISSHRSRRGTNGSAKNTRKKEHSSARKKRIHRNRKRRTPSGLKRTTIVSETSTVTPLLASKPYRSLLSYTDIFNKLPWLQRPKDKAEARSSSLTTAAIHRPFSSDLSSLIPTFLRRSSASAPLRRSSGSTSVLKKILDRKKKKHRKRKRTLNHVQDYDEDFSDWEPSSIGYESAPTSSGGARPISKKKYKKYKKKYKKHPCPPEPSGSSGSSSSSGFGGHLSWTPYYKKKKKDPYWCFKVREIVPVHHYETQKCCEKQKFPWIGILLIGGLFLVANTAKTVINISNNNSNVNNNAEKFNKNINKNISKNINKTLLLDANLTGVADLLDVLLNNSNGFFGGGLFPGFGGLFPGIGGGVAISDLQNVGTNGGVGIVAGGDITINAPIMANSAPIPFGSSATYGLDGILRNSNSSGLSIITVRNETIIGNEINFIEGKNAMLSNNSDMILSNNTDLLVSSNSTDLVLSNSTDPMISLNVSDLEGDQDLVDDDILDLIQSTPQTSAAVGGHSITATNSLNRVTVDGPEDAESLRGVLTAHAVNSSPDYEAMHNKYSTQESDQAREHDDKRHQTMEDEDVQDLNRLNMDDLNRLNDRVINFQSVASFAELPLPFDPYADKAKKRSPRNVHLEINDPDWEFIDENEVLLRMLDDLMLTYKYGSIAKCTSSHLCKLNKAAWSGGQPKSTLVPLISMPTAWILGKPAGKVMDYLHAVWIGRNGKDCDDMYPECSDIYLASNKTERYLESDPADILATSISLEHQLIGEGVFGEDILSDNHNGTTTDSEEENQV